MVTKNLLEYWEKQLVREIGLKLVCLALLIGGITVAAMGIIGFMDYIYFSGDVDIYDPLIVRNSLVFYSMCLVFIFIGGLIVLGGQVVWDKFERGNTISW